ncbi:hypothetical protein TcCL_ESM07731 [Trypanosoma cruzi]|nr:hypothetical protein TcCL_ESM07731 [Trypanosoma cruzi]
MVAIGVRGWAKEKKKNEVSDHRHNRSLFIFFSGNFANWFDDPHCGNACPQASWCYNGAPARRGWSAHCFIPATLHQQQRPREENVAGFRLPPTIRTIGRSKGDARFPMHFHRRFQIIQTNHAKMQPVLQSKNINVGSAAVTTQRCCTG